jgi:hypothetical protein
MNSAGNTAREEKRQDGSNIIRNISLLAALHGHDDKIKLAVRARYTLWPCSSNGREIDPGQTNSGGHHASTPVRIREDQG